MTFPDVPAGLRLCRASGWNQTQRDWEHFLTAAPAGALAAVDETDAVIGTVTTLPFGPFAWVSMVLVDPAMRGKGIGTRLLHRGLALVPPGLAARLDATPKGEAIYRTIGFEPEFRIDRWFLDARPPLATRAPGARPLEAADWPTLVDMDLLAFGASRA